MGKSRIELIVQPEDGIAPLLKAVDSAKSSVDILIFRLDKKDLESALVRAVTRGVKVRALIAHTSKGGEKSLRALETRLLKAGVTVSRTAQDLIRYHGKMMVIDAGKLYILGFNFTSLDIDRSRSFGVVLDDPKLVEEAIKLFEADSSRQPYTPGHPQFLVSPANARQELIAFLKGAKQELMIYDPDISDPSMVRILQERAEAGITLRVIGCSRRLIAHRLPRRMHVRLILRDQTSVFLGSQSLRALELDKRREIGVILEDGELAAKIAKYFAKDWEDAQSGPGISSKKIAKRVAKVVTSKLPEIAPVLEAALKDATGTEIPVEPKLERLENSVKEAVKQAVKDVVRDAVEEGGVI